METPKEIWVTPEFRQVFDTQISKEFASDSQLDDKQVKYLSEASVNEMMAEKDRQIESQRETLQSFKDKYYAQIEIVDAKNKEIARLKSELNDIDRYLDSNSYPVGDRYGNAYSIIERIENA